MRITSILAATGIAALVVTTVDVSTYAASGHSFILGRSNAANSQTTLTRTTNGATLALNSRAGQPALRVNRNTRIPNLNADLVDGYDSSRMVNKTIVFERSLNLTGVSGFSLTMVNVPAGSYQANVSGWVYGPASSSHECYLRGATNNRTLEDWDPGNTSGYMTPHISGVMVLPSTQSITLTCNGNTGNYTSFGPSPMQVALSPIGKTVGNVFAKKLAPHPARAATR